MNTKALLAAACLTGLSLSACAPAVLVGTGAAVVSTVVEERSTMDALKDTEIELGIENALLNHSQSLYGDVTVNVIEGRVLLLGSVPKPEDKEVASRIAWSIDGVNSVDDEVIVAGDSGTRSYFEDVKIANAVRLKLLRDKNISSQNYDVLVFRRAVHLTGLAQSTAELERVIRHARVVEGVTRVVSHVLTIDDPRRVRATATTTSG
jgi:osmotically-inducible protein OsmY